MKNNTSDNGYDPECAIICHASEYMNGADDRAKERLILHLVHRYFPAGTFQPRRFTSYSGVDEIFTKDKK